MKYRTYPYVLIMLFLMLIIHSSRLHAQSCDSKVPLSTPNSNFELKSNGLEVYHKTTKLIWQRCVLGMSWNGKTCTGEPKTYSYPQALNQANGAWRVPTIKELATIVEYACMKPAINTVLFPNTPNNWHWSSSPFVNLNSAAWELDFEYGSDRSNYRSRNAHVRLVRSGQ